MSDENKVPQAPKLSFIRPGDPAPENDGAFQMGAEPDEANEAEIMDGPGDENAGPVLPKIDFDSMTIAEAAKDPVKPQSELTQQDLNSFLLECTDPETKERITLHLPKNFYKVICALEETLKTRGDEVKDDHMILRRYTRVMEAVPGAQPGMPMFEATTIVAGRIDALIDALKKYIMPAAVIHQMLMVSLGQIFEQSRLRMVGITLVDDLAGIGGFALMNQHLAPTNDQARMYVEACKNQVEEFKRQAEKRGFTFDGLILPTAAQVSALGK